MELDVDFSTGLKESDRSERERERVESGSIPCLQENLFDMPQDGREFVPHFSVPVRTLSIADERFFGLEECALCASEARSQKIYSGERTMALYAHFSSIWDIGGLEVSDAGGRQWEISRLWLAMAPCHRIVGNHPR